MIGIEAITNLFTETVYYGHSVNIERRLKEHKYGLKHNKHGNPHLQAAWNKYGEQAFVFAPYLLVENKEDLVKKEQDCIDNAYFLGLKIYNILPASNSRLGILHSEEIKKLISERKKGIKRSKETKNKISRTMKGIKRTEETKKKVSFSLIGNKRRLGIPNTEEQKKKHSIFMIGNNYHKKIKKEIV